MTQGVPVLGLRTLPLRPYTDVKQSNPHGWSVVNISNKPRNSTDCS